MKSFRNILAWILFLWRQKLTRSGRFLLLALFFAGVTGSVSLSVPVYHLFFALVFLYGVPSLYSAVLRPRVNIRGDFPEKASAGQMVHGEFVVENESRFSVYNLALGFLQLPPSLEEIEPEETISLGPGEPLNLTVKLRPRRRGLYDMPAMRAYTTFPFNLWKADRTCRQMRSLLVLPNFHSIVNLDIPIGLRYQPGGIALSSNVGESPEYVGNRDYRYGDSMRRIDFKSWARLAKPAVREYQEEYYCRIALVLDTFVTPGRKKCPDGFLELEGAVSLSASIADSLSRGEYIVDIFAAGPDLYVFRAGRNIAHFDNILEVLACVDECRSNPFDTIAPALADELSNITTVIYVLLDWDETRERFVRAAVESGSKTKVIIVRSGDTTEDFAHAEEWAGPISFFTPEQIAGGGIETL